MLIKSPLAYLDLFKAIIHRSIQLLGSQKKVFAFRKAIRGVTQKNTREQNSLRINLYLLPEDHASSLRLAEFRSILSSRSSG